MIYHSILFSFCLMGMASADINVCLKGDELQVTCKNTTSPPSCTIKAEIPINKEGKDCKLTLTSAEFKDKAFEITCTIDSKTFKTTVNKDKSKIETCSTGSVPQFAGVTLLLALLAPLLSGVL